MIEMISIVVVLLILEAIVGAVIDEWLQMKSNCKCCGIFDHLYVGYDLCIPCLIHIDINRLGIEKYKNNDKRSWERKLKI